MPMDKKISFPTQDELAETGAERAIIKRAHQELEPLVESAALNKMLLKHARRSPEEIQEITGIPAAEVGERINKLLSTTTIQDDLMEEKLLLAEMGLLVGGVRERMSRSSLDDEAWASMARVQLAGLKTLMEQLDKRRKIIDGHLALVSQNQAALMIEAYFLARDIAIKSIKEKYPDLDDQVIYAEWTEALEPAIAYVNKNTSEE